MAAFFSSLDEIIEKEDASEGVNLPSRDLTQFGIFWRRFRTHPAAFLALGVLVLFALMAIFAPQITPGVTPNTDFFLRINASFQPHAPSLDDFPNRIFGNVAYDDFDRLRRSVLTEVTFGARVSLTVSFGAGVLAAGIGIIFGTLSGYFGGWLDALFMRLTDIFLAIPFLPLVATIVILAPVQIGSVQSITLLFALVGWPSIARLVRANFLLLREQAFTEAARAQGVGSLRIAFRHLLPNVLPTIMTAFTSTIALFLVTEATLDFLTIGVTTQMTWGNAFYTSYADVVSGSWWAILFPGLAIVLTVLAVNTVGEALRDALDVRGHAL